MRIKDNRGNSLCNGFVLQTVTHFSLNSHSLPTEFPWVSKNMTIFSEKGETERIFHFLRDLPRFSLTSLPILTEFVLNSCVVLRCLLKVRAEPPREAWGDHQVRHWMTWSPSLSPFSYALVSPSSHLEPCTLVFSRRYLVPASGHCQWLRQRSRQLLIPTWFSLSYARFVWKQVLELRKKLQILAVYVFSTEIQFIAYLCVSIPLDTCPFSLVDNLDIAPNLRSI